MSDREQLDYFISILGHNLRSGMSPLTAVVESVAELRDVFELKPAAQDKGSAPQTSTNSDLMQLLQEWVTLEHQREGASQEYTSDLSRRTYAVLAQLH